MAAFTVFCILILIVLAAILGDHYSRLKKIGWAPQTDEYKQGRSLVDPIGSALGEIGRADAPYKLAAMIFGPIGKVTELAYAPVGMGLNAIGKVTEVVYKPIGMVLGMIGGARRG
jgi:hypothetical protein